jgi:hypothetical protein
MASLIGYKMKNLAMDGRVGGHGSIVFAAYKKGLSLFSLTNFPNI